MDELKDFLKSLIKVVIACGIIALIIIVLLKLQPEPIPEREIEVLGYDEDPTELVLENDSLRFVMDSGTTQFTVEDKKSGKIWYSNPVDAANDAGALTSDKNNLQSTLLVTYGTINGVWTLYNNYSLSIEKGLYNIDANEDRIKVRYTIGNVKKEYDIPIAVPESRMNELLDLMEKKQQKQVKEYYRKYDIAKLRKTDNKDELLTKYPDLENEPIYVLVDSVADYLKKKIEDIFAGVGYTHEDYLEDLARYETVIDQDMPLFNVSMVYSLENDRLVVDVPYDEIEYKLDYPVVSVEILPYMGAGSKSDEGFIIVPENGGGMIKFNNGRNDQNAYTSDIYGWDSCQSRDAVVTETRNAYAAFAIANGDASFVCVADEGASYATVSADVSGRTHSYNHASFTYDVLHYESYDVSQKSNSAFYVYEDRLPEGSIVQKYCFAGTNDYSAMAGVYREYLLDKYPGLAGNSDASLPVVVEVIQAVDKVQQKFGVPVSAAYPLTTYSETVDIADKLRDMGIDKFSMKVSGWMNGGVTHDVPNKVKLISDLGGKRKFNAMLSELENRKIPVYLDGQSEYAYNSNLFDGFLIFRDAAKFTSREEAELYSFSITWYGEEDYNDPFYLLKPQKAEEYYKNLEKFAQSSRTGMSLRNMGYQLNADYNPKNLFTREMIIDQQRSFMDETVSNGVPVMINYGNDYAIEYADIITSMDISGSNNSIIDYDVPFYQTAIHGLVNYVGNQINLAEDYEYELLKAAEYGAGLSFTFMEANPEKLQDTTYTKYYGAYFDGWKKNLESIYKKYHDSFDNLYDKQIVAHKLEGDSVRITEYSDGTKVYVNYGYCDVNVDGVNVPARDYTVERGEAR